MRPKPKRTLGMLLGGLVLAASGCVSQVYEAFWRYEDLKWPTKKLKSNDLKSSSYQCDSVEYRYSYLAYTLFGGSEFYSKAHEFLKCRINSKKMTGELVDRIIDHLKSDPKNKKRICTDIRQFFTDFTFDKIKSEYIDEGTDELLRLFDFMQDFNKERAKDYKLQADMLRYLKGDMSIDDTSEHFRMRCFEELLLSLPNNPEARKKLVKEQWENNFISHKCCPRVFHKPLTFADFTNKERKELYAKLNDTIDPSENLAKFRWLDKEHEDYFEMAINHYHDSVSSSLNWNLLLYKNRSLDEQRKILRAYEKVMGRFISSYFIDASSVLKDFHPTARKEFCSRQRARVKCSDWGRNAYDYAMFNIDCLDYIDDPQGLRRTITNLDDARRFISAFVDYRDDTRSAGVYDYWKSLPEFVRDGLKGDCDDGAAFCAALLQGKNGYEGKVLYVLGAYDDDNEYFGHLIYVNQKNGMWESGGINNCDFQKAKTFGELVGKIERSFRARINKTYLIDLMNPKLRKVYDIYAQKGQRGYAGKFKPTSRKFVISKKKVVRE